MADTSLQVRSDRTSSGSLTGLLDLPAEKDSIGVSGYVDGLAQFVGHCVSPMTIAVQGGWGTGKSSVMEMLAQRLDAEAGNTHTVRFNTWQYSQFNLGEQLTENLLLRIIEKLPTDTPASREKKSKFLRRLAKLKRAGAKLGAASAKFAIPVAVAAVDILASVGGVSVPDSAKELLQGESEPDASPVETIENLRAEFERLVASSGRRVVVFVDDLDRLEPARAVELMEAIKLFMDVENCVFILAIDFDVVKRGVREKYGQDFSPRKARAFFEKIIQVPFQLPVHEYNIDPMLEDGLQNIVDHADLEQYKSMAKASIGNNPRAAKRLINMFMLMRCVAGESKREEDLDRFVTLCFQSAYPMVAEYLRQLTGDFEQLLSDFGEDSGEVPTNSLILGDEEAGKEWRSEWKDAGDLLRLIQEHFTVEDEFQKLRFETSLKAASVTGAADFEDSSENRSRTRNHTDEPAEMRRRLLAHNVPSDFIDWGEELAACLGERVGVVGQQGGRWTLNRADFTTLAKIGSIFFGKNRMSIEISSAQRDNDSDRAVRVANAFRGLPGTRVVHAELSPQAGVDVQPGSLRAPVVKMKWKRENAPDAAAVAQAIIDSLELGV